jgi:RNA polymerase sigma-70 factor (ECF subfamily)
MMLKSLFYKNKFEKIYTENYSRLYYYTLHIVGDSEAAKDILSDVFAGLWNNIDKAEIESINAYLMTSIRHRAVDYLRRNILQTQYSENYIQEATLFYDDGTDELDKDKLVEQMLAQLQPPTKDILEMCYLQRMKYAEVAETLKISTSTVKKHISKALKILRELYNNEK